MRTIGIRATPTEVTFVIYCSDTNSIKNIEIIKIPAAMHHPEQLKYVRVNLLDIIREYEVVQAGIRVTEGNAENLNIERIQIEGVILEAFASSTVKKYFCGRSSSIARLLDFSRGDFISYVNGTLDYTAVENWEQLKKNEKEACFAALGAANA